MIQFSGSIPELLSCHTMLAVHDKSWTLHVLASVSSPFPSCDITHIQGSLVQGMSGCFADGVQRMGCRHHRRSHQTTQRGALGHCVRLELLETSFSWSPSNHKSPQTLTCLSQLLALRIEVLGNQFLWRSSNHKSPQATLKCCHTCWGAGVGVPTGAGIG